MGSKDQPTWRTPTGTHSSDNKDVRGKPLPVGPKGREPEPVKYGGK